MRTLILVASSAVLAVFAAPSPDPRIVPAAPDTAAVARASFARMVAAGSPLQAPEPRVVGSGDGTLIRHDIAVTTVDHTAVQATNRSSGVPNNHLVLAPGRRQERRGRLFLFVVGTGISELSNQAIVQAAVRRGYHAITIAYPNNDAVAVLCAGSTDPDCTGKVREEILTGADLSPIVSIAPQDSLEVRLRNLLRYLSVHYRTEKWGQFLSQGDVDWSLISAAGHSQGAGHVALLAKRHEMLRAVMISGVADVSSTGQTAPWLFRPNRTPAERQYGFTHVADYVVPIAIADASWRAIGLHAFGPIRSADGVQPDYGGSHRLSTALLPASGANPHVAMLDDGQMARNADGSPAHEPVWAFAAFP